MQIKEMSNDFVSKEFSRVTAPQNLFHREGRKEHEEILKGFELLREEFSRKPSWFSLLRGKDTFLQWTHWRLGKDYQSKQIENYSDKDNCDHRARADSDECLTNCPRH